MHAFRVIITVVALLSIPATVGADKYDACTSPSACDASCSRCKCKVCRPVVKKKKVDKWYWVCTEEEFCVPCPKLWPGGCGTRNAVLHTRKQLKRVKIEVTECELDWEVETSCACSGCAEQSPHGGDGRELGRQVQSTDPPRATAWLFRLLSKR